VLLIKVIGCDVQRALKRLKRKLEREGLVREMKRTHDEKPSEGRRIKHVKALKRCKNHGARFA
jgi:small subunit ribosomal protein S21